MHCWSPSASRCKASPPPTASASSEAADTLRGGEKCSSPSDGSDGSRFTDSVVRYYHSRRTPRVVRPRTSCQIKELATPQGIQMAAKRPTVDDHIGVAVFKNCLCLGQFI